MNIFIQKLNENAQIPKYATEGDFGCDVIATSERELAPGVWEYGLGLRYEMDRKSLESQIANTIYSYSEDLGVDFASDWLISLEGRPKSGVWKKGMSLSNCIGTLDEFYRGEMKAIFYHVMPNMPRYKVGDAVVQLMVRISPKINWIEKPEISTETTRGENGFGKMDEILDRIKSGEIKGHTDPVGEQGEPGPSSVGKLGVGDHVTIRHDLAVGNYDNWNGYANVVVDSMLPYAGREATIVKLTPFGAYWIDLDNMEYLWVSSMFE